MNDTANRSDFIRSCFCDVLRDGKPHRYREILEYARKQAVGTEYEGEIEANNMVQAFGVLLGKPESEYERVRHGIYQKCAPEAVIKNTTVSGMDGVYGVLDAACALQEQMKAAFDQICEKMPDAQSILQRDYQFAFERLDQSIDGISGWLAHMEDIADGMVALSAEGEVPSENSISTASLEAQIEAFNEMYRPFSIIDYENGFYGVGYSFNPEYELDTAIADEDVFFRKYLAHHLDSRFDTEWLNSLYTRVEGGNLLRRLGAMVTDFGAISARGRSLYELVPRKQQTVQETVPTNEKMHVVEVLGQPVLFTNTKLTLAELPDGLYMYDFWESRAANRAVIQNHTDGHFGGRMLSKEPLNLGGMEPFIFDKDTYPNFLGYGLTPTEFIETSLTQTEDEPEQAEEPRLGGI